MAENIVHFPSDKTEGRDLAVVRRSAGSCTHLAVLLDEKSRVIECRHCGTQLDPFDWALRWVDRNHRHYKEVKQLRKERKSLLQGIEKLRREETNTKARLKRARNSLKETRFTQEDIEQSKQFLKQMREENHG